MEEITNDVVRLLHRIPNRVELDDDIAFYQLTALVLERREEEIRSLQQQSDPNVPFDPLLHKLRELSSLRREIEEQIRLLVTYSRHFVRPRPYPLAALAEATGLSVSGVRLMSNSDREKEEIVRNIGKPDASGQFVPARHSDAFDLPPGEYKEIIEEFAPNVVEPPLS
ncbi:hypothetical protein [Nonomuraea roseoviolacea]|uniref:Uncharacterized protein n=1 Tax=Nonomuraea roseoviolacea subsp. carminata TaxID=160689 RepID=A0ABT1JZC8_9ACTN|nr:hypothetical protein [Nonomuraea roseoviolacea]MCP2346945.1 hypothetical protein [Nonomuraea roseoviolacea subsp. carminata]